MIRVVGSLMPAAKPTAEAMVPSIPLTPRLAQICKGELLLPENESAWRIGMLVAMKIPRGVVLWVNTSLTVLISQGDSAELLKYASVNSSARASISLIAELESFLSQTIIDVKVFNTKCGLIFFFSNSFSKRADFSCASFSAVSFIANCLAIEKLVQITIVVANPAKAKLK